MKCVKIIEKLSQFHTASEDELAELIDTINDEELEFLRKKAQATAQEHFGNKIFVRGLIEFSSYCKNDCLYCGLRRSNKKAVRYRLSKEQIMQCCKQGYELGFRTFVLQGGEDSYFDDDKMCEIVKAIRSDFSDCAITLSLGERSPESYQRLFDSGADRYLLRHETANEEHYNKLHPSEMSLKNRKSCLFKLKEIGYQTGAGFMVGSPYQTTQTLVEDLMFLKELKPQMCGIGPFIHHKDTPFASENDGSVRQCLILLSIIRLMHPSILLPATTALGTADKFGREMGVLHGANVVMPNLSPRAHRSDYSLYDNKICTGDEAAECIKCMSNRMKKIGYMLTVDRGDYKEKFGEDNVQV
ncbi:MAG: [FeFe] hydrogenase H-cluster radical SAM maturase HydE [Ruminococcus sp.]|nr:[FeFe] hydrogenase H-cluster radical SAM maturase HydE [Ruminococcus sp.]